MKIEYLQITITPWMFDKTSDRAIDIEIKTSTEEYHNKKIFPVDDLESFFNQIWQLAGYELEQYLKVHNEKEKHEGE